MRKRIASPCSVTKSSRRPNSVSADQLPALRKSLVWFTIYLSGETQKSLVPCGGTMTHCNPAGPPALSSISSQRNWICDGQSLTVPQTKRWLLSTAADARSVRTHPPRPHTRTHTDEKDIICIKRAGNKLTALSCCALLTWRTDSIECFAVLESLTCLHNHSCMLPSKHCNLAVK